MTLTFIPILNKIDVNVYAKNQGHMYVKQFRSGSAHGTDTRGQITSPPVHLLYWSKPYKDNSIINQVSKKQTTVVERFMVKQLHCSCRL